MYSTKYSNRDVNSSHTLNLLSTVAPTSLDSYCQIDDQNAMLFQSMNFYGVPLMSENECMPNLRLTKYQFNNTSKQCCNTTSTTVQENDSLKDIANKSQKFFNGCENINDKITVVPPPPSTSSFSSNLPTSSSTLLPTQLSMQFMQPSLTRLQVSIFDDNLMLPQTKTHDGLLLLAEQSATSKIKQKVIKNNGLCETYAKDAI